MRARMAEEQSTARTVESDEELGDLVLNAADRKISVAEFAAMAGLSETELLVSWTMIDPDVVRGAQEVFTSAHMHGGTGYASFILDKYQHLGGEAQASMMHKLVGYAGEQRYFDLMTQNGHTVVQAATSNNPVWDFIVDGQKVNVKAWNDVSGLHHIAAQHPDVVYAVPADVVGHVGGNIQIVPGLSHEQLVNAVNLSIGTATGSDALAAFTHHIPFVALGFIAYREYHKVRAGKEWTAALEEGAVTLTTRTLGAVGGMKFGMALGGMVAGHYGAIIGAPIGTVLGVYGSTRVNTAILSVPLRATMRGLENALVKFGESGLGGIPVMRQITQDHLDRRAETAFELRTLADVTVRGQRWKDWPNEDDLRIVLAAEVAEANFQLATEQVKDLTEVLRRASIGIRQGLLQWGALLAGAPSFARECGAKVSDLAAVVSKQKLVARERAHLQQYAR